jgi:hypothetical protein
VKAIGGVLSGIVIALLLVSVVSIITYLMNVAYDQQLTQESYVNDFISSPKAFQVGPSTIVSNGPLNIKYVIYPNGKVENLSQPFDGRVDLSSLLNGWPWVYVILSNGQAFNVSQPQSSASSTISLLYLESQVPYYADYPLNVWSVSTYQQIITKGLRVNPAHNPTILQNGETIAWNAFGKGTVAVIPVHTGSGWLNFTAIVPAFYWYGVGILLQNGTHGTGQWLAMPIGLNWTYIPHQGWNVTYGLFVLPSSSYYNFTSYNSTLPAWPDVFTLRVAIHFQKGEPAELYVWWLSGSQWVPIKMHTWVPNATGEVAGYSYIDYGWNTIHYFPVYWYHRLITTSFPAYVYSMYTTYDYVYTGVDDLLYTYYHLAPIDLVPGSNVIIVPQTENVYVYNITSTI